MLAPRVFKFLVTQHDQRAADALARLVRQDHVVDKAARAGHKGVGKACLVLGFLRSELLRVALVFAKDNLHRTLGTHHRNLGIRPGQVDVSAQVLGTHHVVRSTVGLACDDGDFRHGALGKSIEQLGAVLDDATVLLAGAWHETGHINKSDDRNVEGIAKAHKARRLDRALDVQAARKHQRLIGDKADRLPFHATKADQDVLRILGLQFKEVAVVDGLDDQLLHVVRLVRVVGHQRVQTHVHTVSRVPTAAHRCFLAVVQRQIVVQAAQHEQGLHIALESQICHAALGGMADGAAEFLSRYVLVRYRLHHFRAGDKHVGTVFHHEDEIGHGRAVNRAASAGPHDHADLWHNAAGHHVALEHIGVAPERGHALLNARTTRVIQANDRCTHLHGLVHHLADLLGMCFRQRAAKDGEILTEDKHQSTVDHAVAGDDTIARNFLLLHAEVNAAVLHEHVPLFEGTFVKQQLKSFSGRQFALLVLSLDAFDAAAQAREFALGFQLFKYVVHCFLRFSSRNCGLSSRA